ncbi:nicotinate phosphoribosyltransferase [Anabaena sp. FACHB-1237]|uniref:nicotinate phosphoribosyltransferase n=1 Tax=Anabaena sp. FACHB-1237 TaxID=2692769 RepID=UPI001680909A|nr:nicotinate phosphoribosyltransferase [Anabaena sp. FACHB-1237]MBD2139728.1 nicotinate phosphoribosyltransferase [Anabaena sp. FACHB-1237]
MAISNISKMLANMTQFVYEAAMRVFAPNKDAYPEIGVQPFTGDIYKKEKTGSW